GHSSNTASPDEIRDAGKVLQDAKANPKCLGFKGIAAVQDVKSGAADLAVVWNGVALREVSDQKDKFAYIIPKEGSIIWVDTLVIPAHARKADMAHRFINSLLDPAIAGRLSTFTRYAPPTGPGKSKAPPDDQANPVIYPAAEIMPRLEAHKD